MKLRSLQKPESDPLTRQAVQQSLETPTFLLNCDYFCDFDFDFYVGIVHDEILTNKIELDESHESLVVQTNRYLAILKSM
jgi:hypothetical protein